MKQLFNKCIKNNKLKIFDDAKKLVKKEFENALNDLIDAKDSFSASKFKWATIQAYYSMFHTARALLYFKGYREKSHICLIASIHEFYAKDGSIPKILIEDMLSAKQMRENADYNNDFTKESSQALIKSAQQFVSVSKKILV